MASINDNNIIFTSVVDSVKGVKGKIQNLNNKYSTYEEGDVIGKFVNAVEIDWNGAQLGE